MAFFRKSQKNSGAPKRLIAEQLIADLPRIGRAVFGGPPPHPDVSPYYLPGFLAAGAPTADPGWSAFVDRFVGELLDASSRFGGWTSAGAFHVAKDFVKSEDWSKPDLVDLMDRALVFLAEAGVPGAAIPMLAQARWTQIKQTPT